MNELPPIVPVVSSRRRAAAPARRTHPRASVDASFHRWAAVLVVAISCVPAIGPARRGPPSAGAARPSIGAALDRLFDSRPFNRGSWGVEVIELRTGALVYERNPQRHFVPASNMKLLVTATALAELGTDFTYRTTVYADGELRNGTLAGDLVLYGRGDPNISGRYTTSPTEILAELAESLKDRGVRRVEGGIVADESYFDADYTRPDWEAYDLLWWYAAPVSALSFNDNSIDFTIRPGAVGTPPAITGRPASRFWSLRNVARTVTRLDSTSTPLDFTRRPGTNLITAYGNVAVGAPEDTESFSVVNPAAWTATMFQETLEAAGIEVARDSVTVVSDPALSRVDSASIALAEHVSPSLERVIFSINKRSQNWHAEQLLKTLGKVVREEGSFEAGIAVERDFLRAAGVESDAVYIRDASGLSAGNLVTPHAWTTLLRFMLRRPHGDVFFQSLPTGGGEGSLRVRFSEGPAEGILHAKDGYIRHVNSLSGYLVPTPADTLVFSIFANNHGIEKSQAIAAIDSAIGIVARAYRD